VSSLIDLPGEAGSGNVDWGVAWNLPDHSSRLELETASALGLSSVTATTILMMQRCGMVEPESKYIAGRLLEVNQTMRLMTDCQTK
jgi:hypothetical protein